MIKLLKKNYFIFFIFILAVVLRLVAINQSLWLDEAIGAEAVKNFSYEEILTEFPKFDNHPPLYYLTLKFWTSLFGYTEISLRFPSMIFGIGTIWIIYFMAKSINSDNRWRFPEIGSLLLATSQIHIYYSQEARMYSMVTFLASLAMYSFIYLIRDRQEVRFWLLFTLSLTALVFTDYVPIFLLPVFWIAAVLRRKKVDWWKKFLLVHLPLIIIGILWLPTLIIQSQKGKWLLETLPGWQKVAGGATLKQAALFWMKFVFGRISLENKPLYYALIILASIPILYSLKQALNKRYKFIDTIWLWFIIPPSLGFLVSFAFPAFIYFRFLYVIPAVYLLIAWGVGNIDNKMLRNITILLLMGFNLLSWIIYVSDKKQQREDWRGAAKFIEQSAGKDDIVIFEYPQPFTPYRWYSRGKIEAVGVTDSISASYGRTKLITQRTVGPKSGVYYFEYLRDLSDPGRVVEETLAKEGFKIKDVYSFVGVGQVYYWVKE